MDVVGIEGDRLAVAGAVRHRLLTVPADGGAVSPLAGDGVLDIDVTAATCRGDLCTIHRRGEERSLQVH